MGRRCLVGVGDVGIIALRDVGGLRPSAASRRRMFGSAGNKATGDPPARSPVAIRIFDAAHPRICQPVVEQPGHLVEQATPVGADQLAKPSSIASGRSVVSRVTSTGFPKEGASS